MDFPEFPPIVAVWLCGLVPGLFLGFIFGWKQAEKARDFLAKWNDGWTVTAESGPHEHEMVEAVGGAMRWCKWCPYTEGPEVIAAMAPRKPATAPSPAPATTLADTAGALAGEAPGGSEGHVHDWFGDMDEGGLYCHCGAWKHRG